MLSPPCALWLGTGKLTVPFPLLKVAISWYALAASLSISKFPVPIDPRACYRVSWYRGNASFVPTRMFILRLGKLASGCSLGLHLPNLQ
jgi:hypothetical protein